MCKSLTRVLPADSSKCSKTILKLKAPAKTPTDTKSTTTKNQELVIDKFYS